MANSCSTMHKIQDKEFDISDFSHDHLDYGNDKILQSIIDILNCYRDKFNDLDNRLKTHDIHKGEDEETLTSLRKQYWWQMIQLLPSSYNQKRTIMLNYEVLSNIYRWRNNHKLDEWRIFCKWIVNLPYSDIITGGIVRIDPIEYAKEHPEWSSKLQKRLDEIKGEV